MKRMPRLTVAAAAALAVGAWLTAPALGVAPPATPWLVSWLLASERAERAPALDLADVCRTPQLLPRRGAVDGRARRDPFAVDGPAARAP